MKSMDICRICGCDTAFGSGNFVNRIPDDDGWLCAMCAGYDCDECGEQIAVDCEIRVDYTDDMGKWHYGNYHEDCYDYAKHGSAITEND